MTYQKAKLCSSKFSCEFFGICSNFSDWLLGPDPDDGSLPIPKQNWKVHLANLEKLYARNSAKDYDGGGGDGDSPSVGGEKFGLTSDQLCRLIKAIITDADKKFRWVYQRKIWLTLEIWEDRFESPCTD